MTELDEYEAYSWLCDRLPGLRARAAEDGWADRLNSIIDAVKNGGSAAAACEKLSLVPNAYPATPRDIVIGPITLGGLGIPSYSVRGEYSCAWPGRCGRRASPGEDGRPPHCAIDGLRMSLGPKDESVP